MKVSISKGNNKMGSIPSVSLPPFVSCPADAPCKAKCYAAKMCRCRKTVRAAYDRNWAIWQADPTTYELQVTAAASTSRFFRWHVSGDIPNAAYLAMMTRIAEKLPWTKFLAFTKQYKTVNEFFAEHEKPENLQIIFSRWDAAWDTRIANPHDLPQSAVIFKARPQDAERYDKICGGDCSACAMQGVGCWELKKGEVIAFHEH
jgi:hypothetical protein